MKNRVISSLRDLPPTACPARVAHIRQAGAAALCTLSIDAVMAQSLKQAGVSIFTAIYGVVGVIGAIACLVTLLNWVTGNWLGREDPKRMFFQSLVGTALAFGVVAIIQFVKDLVGGSSSGISNL